MIITDVKITNSNGHSVVFKATGERVMKPIVPGVVVLELGSALGTPLGLAVMGPGMLIEYSNDVAVTSQVDAESGLVKQGSENDLQVGD